ncbi:hypothetical protein NC652_002141 [Populus alba x Populus x berolinensis]|nr:hypothetical protein NC652_002141 [Populus alba x Populus x berolinensis]
MNQREGDYVPIRDSENVQLGMFDKPLPCFGCGIGWFSLLLGFVFPLMWYFSAILYFGKYYNKDPRERSGLAACAIASILVPLRRCLWRRTIAGASGRELLDYNRSRRKVVADEECLPLLLRSCSRCWCREVRCWWWFFQLLRGCVAHVRVWKSGSCEGEKASCLSWKTRGRNLLLTCID